MCSVTRSERQVDLTANAIIPDTRHERTCNPMNAFPMEDRMKKFMVLYMAPTAEFEKAMRDFTPDQQKQAMNDWMKWMNANQASIADSGAPLGKTKRVDSKGVS